MSKFPFRLEFDIVPVVDIMDAVSVLAAGAEYRESIRFLIGESLEGSPLSAGVCLSWGDFRTSLDQRQ